MENNKTSSLKKVSAAQLRQQAIEIHKKGDLKKAIALYKVLLQHNPNDVGVWVNLGVAYRTQKRYQSSVNCYIRALAIKPNDLGAMGNLANTYKDLRQLNEAVAIHRFVVLQQPNNASARLNYAVSLRENAQFAEALNQLDRALKLEPANPKFEWECAQNLLYLNNYADGFRAYEARWHTGDLPQVTFSCPMWLGALSMEMNELKTISPAQLLMRFKAELDGKTILLHTEQGYGDTILAARYIPLIKKMVGDKGTVILQCKSELHRLFNQIGADILLVLPEEIPTQPLDYHCSLMSLMGAFYTQPDTLLPPAILTVPEASKQKFAFLQKEVSHQKIKKIGIVWSGSVTFANNDNRRLPLSTFLFLANQPNVRLYSLQKGEPAKELYDTGADAYIQDLGKRCDDFADTAAAIEQLDMIIMTDSSVAHLAGSLGKRVINILNDPPYWLYKLDLYRTSWYPSMELIKQNQMALLPSLLHQSVEGVLAKDTSAIEKEWHIKLPDALVTDTGTAKGCGVYAKRAFAEGEVIECAPVLIFEASAEQIPDTLQKYIFCWAALTKNNNNKNQVAIALGLSSLYNHANPANMRYDTNASQPLIRFVAQRHIQEGEELTINYSALDGVAAWPNENWFQRMRVDIV